MSGNNELPTTEATPTNTSVSQSRRNLILASATVPLVATLHSGAAAAASSALQCLGGDFSNKKFVENGNSINGDTAVRVEVPYFERNGSKKRKGPYAGLNKKIYVIDGICYYQSGDTVSGCDTSLLRDKDTIFTESTAHVLYLVDEFGHELGPWPKVQLIEDGGIGNAITQSCWTSLLQSAYPTI